MLDHLAERLRRHIHAAHRRPAFRLPRAQAAIENRNLLVAEPRQCRRRQGRAGIAIVVDDDGHVRIGHQRRDTKFDLAARQRCGVGNLALVKFAALAHVENGVELIRRHEAREVLA